MTDRKSQIAIFCSLLFMGSLIIADFTSVKLASFSFFGWDLLVPLGTFAFAITFWCTDVIGEVVGRKSALLVVWAGVAIRAFFLFWYVSWVIGDDSGNVTGLSLPSFWTADNQDAIVFVFSQSIRIFWAGFVAILVASLLDVYLFHYYKEKHKGRNLFFLRNNISTFGGQLVNSTLFVIIAFYTVLTPSQLASAVVGQIVVKWLIALVIDTPLAYMARNYGQDKDGWWEIWTKSYWRG